jgi:hypothetical protein
LYDWYSFDFSIFELSAPLKYHLAGEKKKKLFRVMAVNKFKLSIASYF